MTLAEGSVTTLQLGVGRSVIVDLPEDAAEIFVGQPKVANAVVRSARRIYVSTLWPGQTSIFALAADGRKIAVLQISVGRDVGELAALLNASIPGNDIHVRTVAESIILTGSVASAGDAQKALDIASGFLSETKEATQGGDGKQVQGKVVNSLTIRGLDQVSLRVTISEIRRDIVKQLGVNMQGVGQGLNSLQIDNPFSVNGGGLGGATATLGWLSAGKSSRQRSRRTNAKASRAPSPNRRSPPSRAKAPSSSPAARSRSSTAKAAPATFARPRSSSSLTASR